jgi:hypothetical protein
VEDSEGKIMLLQPKNWAVFQHYKDRCPPWIKLHRDLLNDRVYMCLPLASKALAPLLWLLASESKDGTFDGSLDELVFRLHITPKDYEEGIKPLIHKGFFVVASGVLADSYQVAIPETERETEKEVETKTERKKSATSVACPLDVSEQVWQDWLALRKSKKAAVTATVLEGARKEAFKLDWPLEKFLIEWCTRGSQGLKAEWIADKQQQTETVYQRSMRLKMQEAVPSIAKQAPEPYQDAADFFRTIDMESTVQLIGDKK